MRTVSFLDDGIIFVTFKLMQFLFNLNSHMRKKEMNKNSYGILLHSIYSPGILMYVHMEGANDAALIPRSPLLSATDCILRQV